MTPVKTMHGKSAKEIWLGRVEATTSWDSFVSVEEMFSSLFIEHNRIDELKQAERWLVPRSFFHRFKVVHIHMNILDGREAFCLETYSDCKQINNYGEKETSATTKRRRTTMKRDPFAGIDATFSRSLSHLLCLSPSQWSKRKSSLSRQTKTRAYSIRPYRVASPATRIKKKKLH